MLTFNLKKIMEFAQLSLAAKQKLEKDKAGASKFQRIKTIRIEFLWIQKRFETLDTETK